MKTITGVIHGTTIQLCVNPGLPDGEHVEVQVRSLTPNGKSSANSIRQLPAPPPEWYPGCTETAAGLLAEVWSAEDDRILAEIAHDRELSTERDLAE